MILQKRTPTKMSKSEDYLKGYSSGYNAGIRNATDGFSKGRAQGKCDMKRRVRNHLLGKRNIPWLAELMETNQMNGELKCL